MLVNQQTHRDAKKESSTQCFLNYSSQSNKISSTSPKQKPGFDSLNVKDVIITLHCCLHHSQPGVDAAVLLPTVLVWE